MALKRYAAKRDKTESAIIIALRSVGATVVPISAAGVADLLVGFRDTTYLVECKSKRGKLTPAQVEFVERWNGSPVVIARTEDEALRGIGAID